METWPSNHHGATTTVGSHDHSERGRDEQIMFVNRKPECQAAAMVEVRAMELSRATWTAYTARARDLVTCAIKKPVVEQLSRSRLEPSIRAFTP